MRTRALSSLAAAALLISTTFTGCKSAPPAAAPTAAGVRNSDGSITNADGSVTYPAGTLPQQMASAPQPAPQPVAPQPVHNADGSTTNPDGSVTYPAGSRPAARETAPAPVAARAATAAPAAPAERVDLTAPAGARAVVTITQTLSASKNNVGDPFSGVLSSALTTSSGATVFPRGTRVEGTVVAAKGRGRFKGAGDLAIQVNTIGGKSASTSEYEVASKGKGKRTGALIGGGGGLGAIIGGLAGGGKGALIGGLAGAGAGTAGAAYTGNKDVVIPSESQVTFRLTQALTR